MNPLQNSTCSSAYALAVLSADAASKRAVGRHWVLRRGSVNPPLPLRLKHQGTALSFLAISGGHAIVFRLLVQIILLPRNAMIHVSH